MCVPTIPKFFRPVIRKTHIFFIFGLRLCVKNAADASVEPSEDPNETAEDENKILFVCPLSTYPLPAPPTQKIILHFHEEKYFIICSRYIVYQNSGFCQRLGLDTTVRQHFYIEYNQT